MCRANVQSSKKELKESKKLHVTCDEKIKTLEDLVDQEKGKGLSHMIKNQLCEVDKADLHARNSMLTKIGR